MGVKLSGHCDRLVLKIYTPAMVCVGKREVGLLNAGWSQVPLPLEVLAGASNGLYYYEIEVERGGQKAPAKTVGRLMVLR